TDDGGRVAGMKDAFDLVKIAYHPADRSMVVMIFVGSEAKYGEIPAGKGPDPVGPPEKFRKGEKLVLDEQHALLTERSREHARVGRGNHGQRIVCHGPNLFVTDAALDNAAGRGVIGRVLNAFRKVDAQAPNERIGSRNARA